jgi:glycosyltransferase involved in cell wall biosynthesis
MYRDKTVAVIIPAYNEEKLIGKVLQTMPPFVDHIVVVDNASRDRTGKVSKDYQKKETRIIYLRNEKNEGVGGSIVTGWLLTSIPEFLRISGC